MNNKIADEKAGQQQRQEGNWVSQSSIECLEEAALNLKCSFVPFIPLHLLAPNQFFFLFHERTFQMIMGWCRDLAEAETVVLKILTLFIFASQSQMVLLVFSEHFEHIDIFIEINLALLALIG